MPERLWNDGYVEYRVSSAAGPLSDWHMTVELAVDQLGGGLVPRGAWIELRHGGGFHPACNVCRSAAQNVYQAVRGLNPKPTDVEDVSPGQTHREDS